MGSGEDSNPVSKEATTPPVAVGQGGKKRASPLSKDSPGHASGKKSKAERDFDKVPPHQFTEETFLITHPFVRKAWCTSEQRKFSGGFCNPGTITHVLKSLLQPVMDGVADTFSRSGKELQWRCVIGTLFSVFRKLSIDLGDDYLKVFEAPCKAEDGGHKGDGSNKMDGAVRNLNDSFEQVSEGSFRDSLTVHEDRTHLPTGSVDFACYVKDKEVTKTHGQEKYCTVALVDSKPVLIDGSEWDGSTGCVWKLGKYGVHHCLENIAVGRKKAVYLLMLASGVFCSAYIQPWGVVEIDSYGEIVQESLDVLLAAHPGSVEVNEPEIRGQLSHCNLARQGHKGTGRCLPPGKHLVGELVVDAGLRYWQTFPTSPKTGITAETYSLVEGFLRVLLGDRVKHWLPVHIDALVTRYEEKMKVARDKAWGLLNVEAVEKYHEGLAGGTQ